MTKRGVDGRALSTLIKKVKESASSGGLYDRTKAALAAEALTQAQLGFRAGRDPYGEAWAPPLLRNGQPLRDTGRLANSFTTEVISDGLPGNRGRGDGTLHKPRARGVPIDARDD